MIPVRISAARLRQLCQCFVDGRDIPAPDEGWNGHELVALAGAATFARISHGPLEEADHPEHRELINERFVETVMGSVAGLSDFAEKAWDTPDQLPDEVVGLFVRHNGGVAFQEVIDG